MIISFDGQGRDSEVAYDVAHFGIMNPIKSIN